MGAKILAPIFLRNILNQLEVNLLPQAQNDVQLWR